MAHFFEILNKQDHLIAEYFRRLNDADHNYHREVDSVTRIQSCFRGALVRERYCDVLAATLRIQRVVRGVQDRVRVNSLLFNREKRRNELFFDHLAACIQKFFRGYMSRKYVHSFYARQAYLDKIRQDGERTNTYLQERYDRLVEEQNEADKRNAFDEYKSLTKELHHLLSTQSMPGVYNPPYASSVPCAFGEPVENHLRDVKHLPPIKSIKRPCNHQLKSCPRSPPQLTASAPQVSTGKKALISSTANAGRLLPVQGPFLTAEHRQERIKRAAKQFSTIQMASKYDAVERDYKSTARINQLTRIAPTDFKSAVKDPGLKNLASVNAESKYTDSALEFREDYNEIPKIPGKLLFHTSCGHSHQFWEVDPKSSERGSNFVRSRQRGHRF